jgi:hypothetical protein
MSSDDARMNSRGRIDHGLRPELLNGRPGRWLFRGTPREMHQGELAAVEFDEHLITCLALRDDAHRSFCDHVFRRDLKLKLACASIAYLDLGRRRRGQFPPRLRQSWRQRGREG